MISMLRFCMYSAYDAGVHSHPQTVLKNLGITYEYAVPQSIADQWWFYLPNNLPRELPEYLTVTEVDPYKHIGYGLSHEVAERLSAFEGE